MATVTTKSTQITNEDATPRVINSGGSYKYAIHWDYTVAGIALVGTSGSESVVNICTIPAGARLLMLESYIKLSATTGASTTIDIGWLAYENTSGTLTAADPDGLVDGFLSTTTTVVALSTITTSPLGTKPNILGVADFSDAVQDVTITITCNDAGGTFDAGVADVWQGYMRIEV